MVMARLMTSGMVITKRIGQSVAECLHIALVDIWQCLIDYGDHKDDPRVSGDNDEINRFRITLRYSQSS